MDRQSRKTSQQEEMNVDCIRTTDVRSDPQLKAILGDTTKKFFLWGWNLRMCELWVTVVGTVLQVEILARLVHVLLVYSPHRHFFLYFYTTPVLLSLSFILIFQTLVFSYSNSVLLL